MKKIEVELLYFIRELILENGIDCIIAVERKGTAAIRALMEMQSTDKLQWPWSKVISSDAIDRIPDHQLLDKKILIFDDMLHTGHHLWDEVVGSLEKKKSIWPVIKSNIVTAAFAVHEDCPKDRLPARWFYNELETQPYERIRASIIEMLQRHGSLLLDTEHIEVRAKVKCDRRQFFEVFAECGNISDFKSSDGRLNLTVDISKDICNFRDKGFLPSNAAIEKIVRKCRVIQRTEDEFAIIPICYPSVSSALPEDFSFSIEIKDIFADELNNEKGLFYAIGLLSAVAILEEILTRVLSLGSEKVVIELPRSETDPANPDVGYTLDHLLAMYPNMNIINLTTFINDSIERARSRALPFRGKEILAKVVDLHEDKITTNARNLALVVRNILDDRTIHNFLQDKRSCGGITTQDIFKVGQSDLGMSSIEVSVALDRLIDEAYFVTHVEPICHSDGIDRLTRTFEPDGEIVSSRLRRYIELHGLPEGVYY